MKQILKTLWLPASIFALAYWALLTSSLMPPVLLDVLPLLPYLLLLLALLLALLFRCGQWVPVVLGLLVSYWAIQTRLQTSLALTTSADLYRFITLFSALLLLLWLLLPRAVTRWRFGLVGIGLLLVFVVLLAFSPWQHSLAALPIAWLALYPYPTYVLPLLPTALFTVAVLIAALRLWRGKSHHDGAMLVVIVIVWVTYSGFYQAFISSWLFVGAALIVCVAVLQNSRDMAFRDELTGLSNRRAFNEHLANLGRRYVIATLDIDHFKQFNDTHGHDVGDEVLKLVASRIAHGMRGGRAYRYGGEEFCMIFPGKALAQCLEVLESIREDIAHYPLTLRNQSSRPTNSKQGKRQRNLKAAKAKQVFVTASIGVAQRSDQHKQAQQVLKASDKALYRAKKKGRNCVVS